MHLGNRVPEHSHPNEQSGYVITGRIRLRFASFDEILEPGDSYSIPENVIRSLEALEPGTVMARLSSIDAPSELWDGNRTRDKEGDFMLLQSLIVGILAFP